MKIFAETQRLLLREIVPSDADGLFALDSDTEVHRYLGNRPVKTIEEVEGLISHIRKQYEDNGIGRWAIVDKFTGEFMGWTGLKWVTEMVNSHRNYYDLGYRLIRKFWGRGFAMESAVASLDYGFEKLDIKEIFAAAHVENIASNRIIRNLGFEFLDSFYYDGSIHYWYSLVKDNWKKS